MARVRLVSALVALGALTACARQPNVDKIPVGTEVQVTRHDGALIEGTLAARDTKSVTVNDGRRPRTVARDDIHLISTVDMSKPAEVPDAARFRELRVPATAPLTLRLDTAVSSTDNRADDPVSAELVEPVVVDGVEVIPAGARLRGSVVQAVPSGKIKGRAALGLRFSTLTERGEAHPIDARFSRVAPATKKKDVQKIAIPAAVGTAIGAIIDGGKGAAAGAAIGGGAGTAVVLSTPGQNISLPRGTVLSLPIGTPLDVRVPVRAGDPDRRQSQ